MSVQKKQHYVPEVFLKMFADANGHFHELEFLYGRIQRRNVSEVCYKLKMYDVDDPELRKTFGIGDDVKYLENNAFKWENYLVDLFSIFLRRDQVIIPQKVLSVIEVYLRIKQRNPHFTKVLDRDDKMNEIYQSVVDSTYEQVRDLLNRYHPDFDFIKLANEFIEKDKADSERLKKIQLRGIVDTLRYESPNFIDTVKQMFFMNFIVLNAGKDDFFLVSDNPGYTMKRIGNRDDYGIYNTDFKNFQQVFFPLNSKQALLLKDFNLKLTPQVIRPVFYGNLPSGEVFKYNLGSTFCTNGKVFCENRDYLEIFKEKLKKIS